MNNKVILIALTAVMLSTVSHAQKVIIKNNAVIIDCSKMDPKFYDSNKKKQTTTASNSTTGPNTLDVISSEESNKKVYKKFEVHKTDNDTKDWLGAIVLCANLTTDGTGWRLPTQRELMLMWILKEKLVANGVTSFLAGYYRSATESGAANAWFVNFDTGKTIVANYDDNGNDNGKAGSYIFRCIRDI